MRLIFLGPPGVGKGTQAQRLSARLQSPKISTGDILREAVARKTALGSEAKSYMDNGKLVPDQVVIGIIQERLKDDDCKPGFILDGFPRTQPQAEALSAMLKEVHSGVDKVLDFELGDEELIRRLSGRSSCPGCQSVFHSEFSPPRVESQCDQCGMKLVQRSDDQPDTIQKRLEVYHSQTQPLIQYYEDQSILTRIDGSGVPDAVYKKVIGTLGLEG